VLSLVVQFVSKVRLLSSMVTG